MADERNLVDEEDAVKENSTKNRREKKKREKKEKKEKKWIWKRICRRRQADSCPDNHFNHCDMDGNYRNSD